MTRSKEPAPKLHYHWTKHEGVRKQSALKPFRFGSRTDWLPALCHGTGGGGGGGGVAPEAIVKVLPVADEKEKVVKVLPVANEKESHEQETDDEDSLSTTSTINYPEEDPNYPEEDDEDDEGEVDMTYTKPKPKPKPKPTEEKKEDEARKDAWVASWENSDQEQCPTWIDVYAYFDKQLGYGGYGVILRNASAKPIIASAKYSRKGKSFFYQVFKGVKAGVELAEELGLSDLHVKCNSGVAPHLFCDARRCSNDECLKARNLDLICGGCFCCLVSYKGCDVSPLVLELRCKKSLLRLSTSWDQAAHYLAKRGKKMNKRDGVQKNEARIEPKYFPQQLKNILWEHAVAVNSKNHAAGVNSKKHAVAVPHYQDVRV